MLIDFEAYLKWELAEIGWNLHDVVGGVARFWETQGNHVAAKTGVAELLRLGGFFGGGLWWRKNSELQ